MTTPEPASRTSTFALFRTRDFTLLWFAGLASYAGMWATLIALPLFVYERTGSTLAAGAVMTAQFAPMLFASAAGVLVDRWDRRRTLVIANLAMTLLTLPLLVPAVAGAGPSTLWIVFASVILVSVAGLVVGPAENALLPTLVGRDQLLAANSMNALNDNLARVIGPAIGGAIAAFVGITGVVTFNAVTYAAAAVLVLLIRHRQTAAESAPHPELQPTGSGPLLRRFAHEWAEGFRQVSRSKVVTVIFVAIAINLLGDSMLTALLAPFAHATYADAAVVLGFLMAARGVGGLIGGLVTGRLAGVPLLHRMAGPAIIAGLLLAVIVLLPVVWVALVAAAVIGIVAVAQFASIQTTIQSNVPNEYLGRIFGSFSSTNAAMMTVGSALAAAAGDRIGINAILLVAAGLYALSGVVTYLGFPRDHLCVDHGSVDDSPGDHDVSPGLSPGQRDDAGPLNPTKETGPSKPDGMTSHDSGRNA